MIWNWIRPFQSPVYLHPKLTWKKPVPNFPDEKFIKIGWKWFEFSFYHRSHEKIIDSDEIHFVQGVVVTNVFFKSFECFAANVKCVCHAIQCWRTWVDRKYWRTGIFLASELRNCKCKQIWWHYGSRLKCCCFPDLAIFAAEKLSNTIRLTQLIFCICMALQFLRFNIADFCICQSCGINVSVRDSKTKFGFESGFIKAWENFSGVRGSGKCRSHVSKRQCKF